MARFLFWSDLHCEFESFDIPVPAGWDGALAGAPAREEIDGILIAGDTDTGGRHLALMLRAWEVWRVPVLAVAGNHEPYGARSFQHLIAHERSVLDAARSKGFDIDVLRCGVRDIAGTRIIGATLWTDLRLRGHAGAMAMLGPDGMNDYKEITWMGADGPRRMWPSDTVEMHRREFNFIIERLQEPASGPVMVMTHHCPAVEAINPRRAEIMSPMDAGFFSDLWHKVGQYRVDAWLHGHSHDSVEVMLEGAYGKTAILSNMRGYPFENCDFDPLRVVDSETPAPDRSATPSLGG